MMTWQAIPVTTWDTSIYSVDCQRDHLLMSTINLEIEINQRLGRFSMSSIIFVSLFDGRRDKTVNTVVGLNHSIENCAHTVTCISVSMLANF
jgi:hypothetical protein